MKKIIKKYGSSLVIIFDAEDQKIYGIGEGDTIELSDITVIQKVRKNKK